MSLIKQIVAHNKANKSDVRKLPPPPVDNAMFHPSRYKIEMCRHYMETGMCPFGDRCLFAHGDHELKPCTFRHPLYKTQMCKLFAYKGVCEFGARCSFIHAKPELERQLQHLEHICGNKAIPVMPMPENPVMTSRRRLDSHSVDVDSSKVLVRSISLFDDELPSRFHLMEKYPSHTESDNNNRRRLSTFVSLGSYSSCDDSDE